jgi:hypothetical protein
MLYLNARLCAIQCIVHVLEEQCVIVSLQYPLINYTLTCTMYIRIKTIHTIK